MEISYSYTKVRREFGKHPKFVDASAEMLADVRPNEEHAKQHIERRQVTAVIQVMPDMTEHEVQTNPVAHANKAVNHVEGGWPKEVDFSDAELTIRYRKKVEKDEQYAKAVAGMGAVAENIMRANNAIDIYEDYFDHEVQEHSTEAPHGKTLAVLHDPAGPRKRTAQSLSWHPDGSRKIAVAYCFMEFQGQEEGDSLSSYVWDLHNPNVPECELRPGSALTCVNYNLKDSNLLGAGQYNGQVSFFDVRKGSVPVDSSQLEHSHRDPVYDFAWLQSKTGTEAMSAASDGSVMWWDIRKLAEPTETLTLTELGSEKVLGAVSLDYSPQAGPTKFLAGTEQGLIIAGNRKAKSAADRIGTSYTGHHGPVYAVVRSPFFPKFFLSAGDWTARLWNEDLKLPIINSKYSSANLNSAKWSPTRPGVFLTARADGRLDVWDLFYKQNDPVLSLHLADRSLTSIRLQENGRVCGVGSADGGTTILHLSKGLADIQPNEKHAIGAMFERETSREKNLEKAVKEAKIKARKEAAKGTEAVEKPLTEEDLQRIEREFWEAAGPA